MFGKIIKTQISKSDNLQCNMLGRWVDGTFVSSIKCLLAKFSARILSVIFLQLYKIKNKEF
jgi:hypothetical protein